MCFIIMIINRQCTIKVLTLSQIKALHRTYSCIFVDYTCKETHHQPKRIKSLIIHNSLLPIKTQIHFDSHNIFLY